ncbi:low molecular weight phosphatase family protein, partial [Methanosarcinales archaeon]
MRKILFVCVENACRSQMAQGFFNKLATKAIADSAGTY